MVNAEGTHADDAHRVLIVDDHPDTAEILAVMFELLGHETRSAPRGREALRTARSFDPALVVLDIGLPDISGYEVVNALRAATNGQDRYIVAVTGWSGRDDIEKAKRAGFDAHFVKPIDIGTIRDMLRVTAKRMRVREARVAAATESNARGPSETSREARRGPRSMCAPAARVRASDRRE